MKHWSLVELSLCNWAMVREDDKDDCQIIGMLLGGFFLD